ncbi:MAG: hypothetical protein ABEL76_10975 [Bradymonadaceae bacterium]
MSRHLLKFIVPCAIAVFIGLAGCNNSGSGKPSNSSGPSDAGPSDAEPSDNKLTDGWNRHPRWCDGISGACCDPETGEFEQRTTDDPSLPYDVQDCSWCPPGTVPCFKNPPDGW